MREHNYVFFDLYVKMSIYVKNFSRRIAKK